MLAALLWPDSEPQGARTALRTLLDDAGTAPAQPPHLLSEHDLLGLNPQARWNWI